MKELDAPLRSIQVPKYTAKLPRDVWSKLEHLGFPVQHVLSQQHLQLPIGVRRNKPGKKEMSVVARTHACAS
eukprot:194232-Amphidinium_carterae.1